MTNTTTGEIVARFTENGQDCLAVRVREQRTILNEDTRGYETVEVDVEYIGRHPHDAVWEHLDDDTRLAYLLASVRAQIPRPPAEPDPSVGRTVTL